MRKDSVSYGRKISPINVSHAVKVPVIVLEGLVVIMLSTGLKSSRIQTRPSTMDF
jgi:hypothetical protein